MSHDIFISHSSHDRELATNICDWLEARGFSCWIAPRDIEPGMEYSQCLNDAISKSKLFLLALSESTGGSKHVRRELEIADRKEIAILPVRVDQTTSFGEGLDYYVGTQQWYDALERPLGASLERLEGVLRSKLGDPEVRTLWKQLGGHLAQRYAEDRPRALLSLDGGGVRGLITLEILSKIERLLASTALDPASFRLCDYFDYVAGSGSGALIAIALAQGKSVAELLEFYTKNARAMFGNEVQPFGWFFLPDAVPPSSSLEKALRDLVGEDTTLSPASLKCLLMVVVRHHPTNTPWPISSNPLAKFNAPTRADANLRIPLLSLARASTKWTLKADLETVRLFKDDPQKAFVFGDGFFTPLNNPAFQLYQMATSPEYRLKWRKGERNLLLVSVGAGQPQVVPAHDLLIPFMASANVDQDVKCRSVGRCVHGPVIDREIGDLIPRNKLGHTIPRSEDTRKDFAYVRFDADISRAGVEALGITDPRADDSKDMRPSTIDSALQLVREIGKRVAISISEEHVAGMRPR